ncbi:MAG TPA: hypothetical protein PK218_08460 [Flavobacterium sp.]|jgi:hypothetical protein|uniref:hypothetical protein n=1 Tax=Flavobacterium sp. TaxID=239 RepID=UPI002C7B5954|nr:hypothetical protein [Flavobacterium sp.]HPW98578.1 hypothetical protein [Flavobacterium sp.]HQA74495.1 hypothetical protein [Flavobacterium sp.]
MKKIALLFLLTVFNVFSQNINDYKFVIVPTKFDFLKEDNSFNLNTSTKLLLEKYGFEVFMNNQELPTEIANNRCKTLTASLAKDNSMFQTKIKLVLKDCQDRIVYETAFGTSREKDYNKAYNQAFREAAKSFETLNYKYNGEKQIAVEKIEENQEVKSVEPYSLSSENSEIFYFAQPIANGFQVVNNEPRVIMRLFTTSQKGVFIGIKGDQNGVVITKNGKWFFECYEGGKLTSEPINLRF